MIDHTNSRIEEHEAAIGHANRRRYAFHRILAATDRLLGHLEELNRDGVTIMPMQVRLAYRKMGEMLPVEALESLHDTRYVQDALNGVFEVQEKLFRWRYPEWHDWDPDAEAETVAS